jgi:DnaJ-class molecular chaperone
LIFHFSECIKDCQGHGSGYYGSCKTCYGYVTCVWGIMYERKCPSGLKWNSDLKVCDYNSKCSIP